jgi:hypothetical protein
LDTGIGYWILDIGFWILDIGLDIGYWIFPQAPEMRLDYLQTHRTAFSGARSASAMPPPPRSSSSAAASCSGQKPPFLARKARPYKPPCGHAKPMYHENTKGA